MSIPQEDLEKLKIEANEAAQQAFIEIATKIDKLPEIVNETMSSALKRILIASTAYPIVGIDRDKFKKSELALLDLILEIKELQATIMLAAMFAEKPKETENE